MLHIGGYLQIFSCYKTISNHAYSNEIHSCQSDIEFLTIYQQMIIDDRTSYRMLSLWKTVSLGNYSSNVLYALAIFSRFLYGLYVDNEVWLLR